MDEQKTLLAQKNIADTIRNARLKVGLSQKKLAIRAGTDTRTIQRLENCEVWTNLKPFIAICEALNIPFMTFFNE